MVQRSLDGMTTFIRRVSAQIEAARHNSSSSTRSETTPPAPSSPAQVLSEPADAQRASEEPLHSQTTNGAHGSTVLTDWQIAEEALKGGSVQEATVVGWNRGGLLVQWRGLQGFLPASQFQRMIRYTTEGERDTAFASRVGEVLYLKIIEVDCSRNRLVFSERALQWESGNGQCLWEDLAPGQIRRGRVRNLCDFGAFVDLGGIDGLIHISQLAWHHVRHPSEVLQIGADVDVFVMAVEPERQRVALSLKRLTSDPWDGIDERYTVGQTLQGVVTNVLNFGAFVRVEDGVEGLIHISELAGDNSLHPRGIIAEGDAVTVRVLNIDRANRRLALSLRQAYSADGTDTAHN